MRRRGHLRLGCAALVESEPKVNLLRRVLVLLGTLFLMMAALSACGDDAGAGSGLTGGETDTGKVSFAGTFGKEPKVTFDGIFSVSKTKVNVLSEGDGEEVEVGDAVFANLYIANGFTGEQAASTWDDGDGRTTMLEVSGDTVPGIRKAVEGHTIGSRVAVEAASEDAFGEAGNPDIAIAPGDTVVFVVDLVSKIPDSINAKKAASPAGAPKVVEKNGTVTGLRFTGKPEKIDELETITLVEGKGKPAKKDDTLVVKYLGQVNGKKKVFDENFSKDSRYPITLGQPGSIKGWNQGLEGARAGSRVILRIPSALGYGKKGSGKDIKPGDDLVFVVDVLAINN